MRKSGAMKLFIILVFSTAFLFSAIQLGSSAYASIFPSEKIFAEGTKIGQHDLSGKDTNQALTVAEAAVSDWMEQTEITFHYKERSYTISNALFVFDIQNTVANIVDQSVNEASVTIDENILMDELVNTSVSINTGNMNLEKLIQDLMAKASMLNPVTENISLESYINNGAEEETLISLAAISAEGYEGEVASLVQSLPEITIAKNSRFSLLEFLETEGYQAYSSETLSLLATGMYEASLLTNFSVIERHISAELPEYAKLGYEARVSLEQNKDFVFMNGNNRSFTFELSFENNRLVVALNGGAFLYDYAVRKEDGQTFAPETIVQFDPKLAFGQKRVVEEGKAGQLIKMYREVRDETGALIVKEPISEDFYAPVYRKEIRSLIKPPVVEIVEEVETNENENTDEDNETSAEDEVPSEEDSVEDKGDQKQEDMPEANQATDLK